MKTDYSRWPTRVVKVGQVKIGGNNPIRIQSMTTSSTRDVQATIDQIVKLADCGAEMARVTVQGKKEAEACEEIKNGLIQRGYEIPLIADIHFYPPAAMLVAEFVDKVRINPGNYIDRRAIFKTIEYTDESYAKEVEKIEEGFTPLVLKCKQRGIAMRIGTNHGSLSDRIMSRYGDTPAGMVESAIEFAHVCRKHDYHNFLFSMKASNPLVMIDAYRSLVAKMNELHWNYPLHLGVTEAGEGEDGLVKSAAGIGSLLLEGIGDTIRVSLTEDPWAEIDPCRRIVSLSEKASKTSVISLGIPPKREIETAWPFHPDGSVLIYASKEELMATDFYEQIGAKIQLGRPAKVAGTADIIVLERIDESMQPKIEYLKQAGIGVLKLNEIMVVKEGERPSLDQKPSMILLELNSLNSQKGREFFAWLDQQKSQVLVILMIRYALSQEDLTIYAAAELGSLLCDRLGDGILLLADQPIDFKRSLSFSILQAARRRSSKTEFIACPGCGRTLFDIQSVTKKIQEKTKHLTGVKIAIMGCVVNGPGEMADADFGYVGSRTNKVDLYVGKTCVERNIDHSEADQRLIDLIKQHGKWIEPEILVESTMF